MFLAKENSILRKYFVALFAAFAMVLGSFAFSAAPANAYIYDVMLNGKKFWTGKVCVGSTLNQTTYPTGAMAQGWNNVIGTDVVALDASTNCDADGYTPSTQMVIGTFSNPNIGCLYFTNQQYNIFYNGFYRWTNKPGIYLNTGSSRGNCTDTLAHRKHWISEGIGYVLGLDNFGSAGWNSHVMNETIFSVDNVPMATAGEGQKVREIYLGVFCDQGTVC